ncbi:MAG: hypothetical protein AAFQ82_23810, partial [Myxococcota bacterium]
MARHTRPVARGLSIVIVVAGLLSCGDDNENLRDCSATPIDAALTLPLRLTDTPLYTNEDAISLNPRAIEFSPRFPLWTDGASKRRWILLPEDGVVDSSDANHWVFPEQSRLFKEFTRDGVRIETRMSIKTAGGWTGA